MIKGSAFEASWGFQTKIQRLHFCNLWVQMCSNAP